MDTDRVRADVRRKKIAANLLAGMGPHEIAEVLGETPDAIAGDVREILGQWIADQAGTGDASLDLQRLDLAINALWTQVNDGDKGAIDLLLKIVRLRRQIGDPPSWPAGVAWAESGDVAVCRDGGREADEDEGQSARMPEWVPDYLACWGSTRPDGKRMTVSFAADFAGTTPEAVRKLRERSATFKRLEEIARHGTTEWAQSYIEAGLRTLAPGLMRALSHLVGEHNPQVVLKLAEWLRGKPQEVDVLVDDVRGLSDEERAHRIAALLERARARRVGPAAGDE